MTWLGETAEFPRSVRERNQCGGLQMKRIDALFDLHRAKSDLFNRYKAGPVPYVGNGLSDNAVVGLVTPLPTDRVFGFMGICCICVL